MRQLVCMRQNFVCQILDKRARHDNSPQNRYQHSFLPVQDKTGTEQEGMNRQRASILERTI